MKTEKMSLANAEGKLSRKEMKTIMAGSFSGGCGNKIIDGHLWVCTDGRWVDMGPYNPGF